MTKFEKLQEKFWQFTSRDLSDSDYFVRSGIYARSKDRTSYTGVYNYTYMNICGQAIADFAKKKIAVHVGKAKIFFEPKTGTVFANARTEEVFFEEVFSMILSLGKVADSNEIFNKREIIYLAM